MIFNMTETQAPVKSLVVVVVVCNAHAGQCVNGGPSRAQSTYFGD